MVSFPWKEQKPSNKKLLKEEVNRQLTIMKEADPSSVEYAKALERYKVLDSHSLSENRLTMIRNRSIRDGALSVLLALITITAEQWTPITTKWYTSLARKVKSGNDF